MLPHRMITLSVLESATSRQRRPCCQSSVPCPQHPPLLLCLMMQARIRRCFTHNAWLSRHAPSPMLASQDQGGTGAILHCCRHWTEGSLSVWHRLPDCSQTGCSGLISSDQACGCRALQSSQLTSFLARHPGTHLLVCKTEMA